MWFFNCIKCVFCLQVWLIVFRVVFIAHHRPVMFKRVPQVSGAFSNLELDGGQWRKENETSVRGKINVYFLLVELYSSSGELQEWSFQKMFNKKANLLHQCSKNCMHVKDLLVFQHAQCTCTMMFGLSEILKRDWRGKSQGQNCGMVFLKSIYGVRVFCQWLYIYLIYSFIQCELFCLCIHFLLWGVTVLQAKRPHLLVVMPAFLCVKQLGVRSLIYHNLSIRIISNLSH